MCNPGSDLDRILAERAGWTWFDDCLLHTCRVVHQMIDNRLSELQSQPTRTRLDPGERCLAEGPARMYVWRSAGDGTWEQSSLDVSGSTSFVVGAHVANAILNRSRQKRAENQLQPRWIEEPSGSVMVSDQRLFFTNQNTSFSLPWSALDRIEMTAADLLCCEFVDGGGNRNFIQLRTAWTALMFTVAAHLHFPAHPLLVSGGWLLSGFEEKCHLAGKEYPTVRRID
jgi:hypothetical protein